MSTIFCALSNESPDVPVVSPVSGQIYERRLIEKYINENGVDPINQKPLDVEQLILIKNVTSVVKPRPPQATSIPAILKNLQDEWDSVMLHSFTLRQDLQSARQELSHALYQHDAACRVIARLTKELTAAREALATLKPQVSLSTPAGGGYHETASYMTPVGQETPVAGDSTPISTPTKLLEPEGMSMEIIDKLQAKATILTQERKKRGKIVSEDLVLADSIRTFITIASHPGLHAAGAPGILSLDISPNQSSHILTGGADKTATVFNKDTEQVIAVLKGHTKRVSRVVYHPNEGTVITASNDSSIRYWDISTCQTLRVMRPHQGPITGLSLHATGDYVLSSGTDRYWAFSDIMTGKLISRVTSSSAALTCAQFHPDGLIFGTGTSDSEIKIWDLKEQQNVASFTGHSGQVSSLCFSENGYYLATAADDACIKLWDLRKLKNIKTIHLDEGYEVRDLCFDQSATYLAAAGTDVRVYLCKQWQELKVFHEHTAMATGVRFGKNSTFLASTSMDRTLKLYAML